MLPLLSVAIEAAKCHYNLKIYYIFFLNVRFIFRKKRGQHGAVGRTTNCYTVVHRFDQRCSRKSNKTGVAKRFQQKLKPIVVTKTYLLIMRYKPKKK